jgi:hypothetical protein
MKKRNYPQWDMAGLTSRNYTSPKPRKPIAAVGEGELGSIRCGMIDMHGLGGNFRDHACGVCGFHVCDCLAKVDRLFAHAKDEGFSVRGYRVFSNAKCSVDDAFFYDDTMAAVVSPSQVDMLRAEVVAEDERRELQKREAEAAVKFLNEKNAQRELARMQQRAAEAAMNSVAQGYAGAEREELIRRRQQNAYGAPDSVSRHLLDAYERARTLRKNF